MIKSKKSLLNRHFALVIALMFAAMAAILIFVLPQWRLDRLLNLIGVGQFFPGVSAPYGMKARLALLALSSVATFASTWLMMRFIEPLLGGKRARKATRKPPIGSKTRSPAKPASVRAADAHPDAPPRRPIFAEAELGAPLMSVDAASADGELLLGERDQALPLEPVAVQPPPGFIPEYQSYARTPESVPVEPVAQPDSIPPLVSPVSSEAPQSQPLELKPQARESLFAETTAPNLDPRPSFAPFAPSPRESIFAAVPDMSRVSNEPEVDTPAPPPVAQFDSPQYSPAQPSASDNSDDGADKPPISALVERLDAALKRRAANNSAGSSGLAERDGDIGSLREALRSFGGVA